MESPLASVAGLGGDSEVKKSTFDGPRQSPGMICQKSIFFARQQFSKSSAPSLALPQSAQAPGVVKKKEFLDQFLTIFTERFSFLVKEQAPPRPPPPPPPVVSAATACNQEMKSPQTPAPALAFTVPGAWKHSPFTAQATPHSPARRPPRASVKSADTFDDLTSEIAGSQFCCKKCGCQKCCESA